MRFGRYSCNDWWFEPNRYFPNWGDRMRWYSCNTENSSFFDTDYIAEWISDNIENREEAKPSERVIADEAPFDPEDFLKMIEESTE